MVQVNKDSELGDTNANYFMLKEIQHATISEFLIPYGISVNICVCLQHQG